MSLPKQLKMGEFQIHMVIRGAFHSPAEPITEEGEMAHIEHFREIIGLIKEGLIVMLVMKWGGGEDNGHYFDEDWCNSDYQGDHSQSQVNFTAKDNNYPPQSG